MSIRRKESGSPRLGAAAAAATFRAGALPVHVFTDGEALASWAAATVQGYLAGVLARRERARVVLATGNSQIAFLERLARLGGVDWSRVTCFHMDEYLGLAAAHPASFRAYMRRRVARRLRPGAFHYLEGDADEPIRECERYEALLREGPIDLCCLGIGENGHLAFNDPHVADFKAARWVNIVSLDRACRQQQANEGHFPSLEAVPRYALTLTIPALCAASRMVCICPERRKARAVRAALEGPVSEACPASFLRRQPRAVLLLDTASASGLRRATRPVGRGRSGR
jgi:glucosamine-6-phosphate deaminase